MKFGLTRDAGLVDFSDRYLADRDMSSSRKGVSGGDLCRLLYISRRYPITGRALIGVMAESANDDSLRLAIEAVSAYGDSDFREASVMCESENGLWPNAEKNFKEAIFPWQASEEWAVLKEAVMKDEAAITKAAKQADAPPRLIVSLLVAEQLRLYNSEREIFKQVFAPLKMLGAQSQFSLGVVGVKEETAKAIESHLTDRASPYYLGAKFEKAITSESVEPDAERFYRLIDEHDHFYSYFYAGLMAKQIMAQWKKAGFPIDNRPEIIATVFNLGFHKSFPKDQPLVGGAEIEINGQKISFGELAYQFYYSGELAKMFPIE